MYSPLASDHTYSEDSTLRVNVFPDVDIEKVVFWSAEVALSSVSFELVITNVSTSEESSYLFVTYTFVTFSLLVLIMK